MTTRCNTDTSSYVGKALPDCHGDDVNISYPLAHTYHTQNKNVMYTHFHAMAETGLVEQSQRGGENHMETMAIENSAYASAEMGGRTEVASAHSSGPTKSNIVSTPFGGPVNVGPGAARPVNNAVY